MTKRKEKEFDMVKELDATFASIAANIDRAFIESMFRDIDNREYPPIEISLNSQGWKYFVSLSPGQITYVEGATYKGIPIVVHRSQIEPIMVIDSPDRP
jgi:hypothetical protein